MANPKKTKSKGPSFPPQLYVTTNRLHAGYFICDKNYEDLLNDIYDEPPSHVAIYELKEVKKVNHVPATTTLESL